MSFESKIESKILELPHNKGSINLDDKILKNYDIFHLKTTNDRIHLTTTEVGDAGFRDFKEKILEENKLMYPDYEISVELEMYGCKIFVRALLTERNIRIYTDNIAKTKLYYNNVYNYNLEIGEYTAFSNSITKKYDSAEIILNKSELSKNGITGRLYVYILFEVKICLSGEKNNRYEVSKEIVNVDDESKTIIKVSSENDTNVDINVENDIEDEVEDAVEDTNKVDVIESEIESKLDSKIISKILTITENDVKIENKTVENKEKHLDTNEESTKFDMIEDYMTESQNENKNNLKRSNENSINNSPYNTDFEIEDIKEKTNVLSLEDSNKKAKTEENIDEKKNETTIEQTQNNDLPNEESKINANNSNENKSGDNEITNEYSLLKERLLYIQNNNNWHYPLEDSIITINGKIYKLIGKEPYQGINKYVWN